MYTLIQFLIIGIVCFVYNKPLARELARIYAAPFRWIFGEKPWVVKMTYYFSIWMRIGLYGGAVMSLVVIVLTIGNIYNLF